MNNHPLRSCIVYKTIFDLPIYFLVSLFSPPSYASGLSCGAGSLNSVGSVPQMSLAYSAIVRSLENFPEDAMLCNDICAHFNGF